MRFALSAERMVSTFLRLSWGGVVKHEPPLAGRATGSWATRRKRVGFHLTEKTGGSRALSRGNAQGNPIEGVSKENGHVGSGGLFRCAVEIVVVFACSVSRQTLEHLGRQGVHAGRERSPERLNILSRSIFPGKAADAVALRGPVFAVGVKAQGFFQDLGNVGVRVEAALFGLLLKQLFKPRSEVDGHRDAALSVTLVVGLVESVSRNDKTMKLNYISDLSWTAVFRGPNDLDDSWSAFPEKGPTDFGVSFTKSIAAGCAFGSEGSLRSSEAGPALLD